MNPPASMRFAHAARQIGHAARAMGLRVPGFRCPPRTPGADRALRRADGSALVAVRLQGREFSVVIADMIEGVLAVNGLHGAAARDARERLRLVVDGDHAHAA